MKRMSQGADIVEAATLTTSSTTARAGASCGSTKSCYSESGDFILRTNFILSVFCFCILYLAHPSRSFAQDVNPPQPLRLDTAVDPALGNFPRIRTARAHVAGAFADIDLAPTVYLPRL